MTTNAPKRSVPTPKSSVIAWLLDSDPAIRWQTMRDLTDAPAEDVAAARAQVATAGWGAQLLALQGADGAWPGEWDATMHALSLLREMGLDPTSDAARQAVELVRGRVTWRGWDWDGSWRGQEFDGNPFFAGEVEPCINGQVGASGAYFGVDFYFIALTKKILLLEELESKVNFNSSIYLMDTLNSGIDLFENKSTFNKQFLKLFGLKKKEDFLIAYIHRKSGTLIFTDKLKIDEKKIRKMMKKK